MSYRDFHFSAETEYIFTTDVCAALEQQLRGRKIKKLFVLASSRGFSQVAQALSGLAFPVIPETGCMANPTAAFVGHCAGEIRREGCDFLLAVGGGSAIDAAKAAALLAANPSQGGIWDYIAGGKTPSAPALPVGLVVTIPSTGSESNPSAVITDPVLGEKRIYTEPSMQPRFSITAPELTYTLPAYPAACGIADIFCHLLEQYLHNDTGVQLSDNLLLGAMGAVVQWGPKALAQPYSFDAQSNLLFASYLAMCRILAVGHSENWISHMVEHALSGRFHLAHGAGMAIVMPAYMEAITPWDVSGRLSRLSREVFGCPDEPAHRLTRQFFRGLNLPASLREAEIALTDASDIAGKSLPYGSILVEGYPPFTLESARSLLERIR